MTDPMLCYSIGPLLYCPANNESIVNSIINEKFAKPFSLALCLEDTIKDDCVPIAEDILIRSIHSIYEAHCRNDFYIPKIFIRVRYVSQIKKLLNRLEESRALVTGFIFPKFSLDNGEEYINTITSINEHSTQIFYMMPILESPAIIDLRLRHEILYDLKEKLDTVRDLVLNVRVGGNDLCHAFGFRRHSNESIHSMKPISNIFSDIITVFGMDYVVSGPVWEYYNGEHWKEGLIQELKEDRLCGFIGKTVIHPKQIESVNHAYKVSLADLTDAKAILHWNKDSHTLVSGSSENKRMNEYKTHFNWAQKIIMLAQCYGTV